MTTVLVIVLPIVVYVIGILCGRLSVKRTAEEGIRLHNASVKARIAGMQVAMSAESQRADEYAHGQRAMITHLETMLRAHAEYGEALGTTANALRLELTRYILGEVPEHEIIEARANLLTMTEQNETQTRHVQEPLMIETPEPAVGFASCVCGTFSTPIGKPPVPGHSLDAHFPCGDKRLGTDYEAEDNYVAEGHVDTETAQTAYVAMGFPTNVERFLTTEVREARTAYNHTQIELSRRHPANCDCAYCLHVGD